MPSIKKAFQCWRTAALISDCSLSTSGGKVIEDLPMLAAQDDTISRAPTPQD
jgi:hypothetical protein